jgi:pyruvate dehydrogenase E2 component (dihydrolipoamide acetyltransferase)|tara:strand:- start:22859 stop:24199 length:1341 start_codon:yes stop_codon:yes gene_type:complete
VSIKTVVVPDLGGAETVDVIELSLAVGDNVELEGALLVLESDKATMDVPSPFDGQLVKYLVAEGDTVKVGDAIAELETIASSDDAPEDKPEASADLVLAPESPVETSIETVETVEASPTQAQAPVELKSQSPAAVVEESQTEDEEADIYAGPSVRMLARELGVQLGVVRGSGPRGRILRDDVNDYVKAALAESSSPMQVASTGIAEVPTIDFSQFGTIDTVKMTKIQKVTAANMQRNWLNVPHVTQFDEADTTDMDSFRKSLKAEGDARGIRISPVAFLIKAIAIALQENPVFLRSLAGDGENYIQKHYCNIGMAVDTPRGLVVPVIRDVANMGLWDIAAAVTEFAGKAREGKLKPADMQGGCFTLSSLGAIGGNGFTPIVNAPEAGILGVSKAQIKPVWDGQEFQPRLMLPLALSYDHRLVNGGDAGRFITQIVKLLSDVRHLAL